MKLCDIVCCFQQFWKIFIAHAQKCSSLSTSGLKSDISITCLAAHISYKEGVNILAIHIS